MSLVRDTVLLLVAIFSVVIAMLGGRPEALSQSDWVGLVGLALFTVCFPVVLYYALRIAGKFIGSVMLVPFEYLTGTRRKVPRSLYFLWSVRLKKMSYKTYIKKWKIKRNHFNRNAQPVHPVIERFSTFSRNNAVGLATQSAVWGRRLYLLLVVSILVWMLSLEIGAYASSHTDL